MTIKEQLLQEIESSPDTILAETLNFLRFLKTKETVSEACSDISITQPTPEAAESATHTPVNSTGRSFLEHLKIIGKWEGDDLQECLRLVYATRGKAKFDYDNPLSHRRSRKQPNYNLRHCSRRTGRHGRTFSTQGNQLSPH